VNAKYEWKFDASVRKHFFKRGDRLRSSVFPLGEGGQSVQVCALIAKGASIGVSKLALKLEPVVSAGAGDLQQRWPVWSYCWWKWWQRRKLLPHGRWSTTIFNHTNERDGTFVFGSDCWTVWLYLDFFIVIIFGIFYRSL
jgi:hypothetical protein